MRCAFAFLAIGAIVLGCKGPETKETPPPLSTEVKAADGYGVNTKLEASKGEPKGIIVLFHQAGSNMHEYDPIAPRFNDLGWDCLLVDARSGGAMWGFENKTAAQFESATSYEDAYQDIEAAFEWAKSKGYKKTLVMGSSYSASLVLRLAAEHKGVDAVLAFSPGEYFDKEGLVAGWSAKAQAPVFFASTSEEMGGGVQEIIMARMDNPAHEKDKGFALKTGVHGASTLRTDKAPEACEEYWKRVEEFLDSLG